MVLVEEFCKYKAFTMSLKDPSVTRWGTMFDDWRSAATCSGPSDPRVLPLHIFAMQRSASRTSDLDEAYERHRFRQMHLRDGQLRDADWRRWNDGTPHGRVPQFVRNVELPLGFHWDVSKKTSTNIETPMSVWKVIGRGYINVYANGYVRPGRGCSQIWNESQSKAEDENELRKSRHKI